MSKDNRDFFKSKNCWSEIKDRLLGCYLSPYFQKLLSTNKPICYVDCFAGQGKFDDGKPGSPLIALQIRADRIARANENYRATPIDVYLIELNHADTLRENVLPFYNSGSIFIFSGKYEEKIEDILSTKRGANVFLYVDPYGIRALDYNIFRRLDNFGLNTFEILINFNSFGFFRDACRVMGVGYSDDEALNDLADLVEYAPTRFSSSEQSTTLLTNIAGGDYWKSIVEKYNRKEINGYEAEQMFSQEYKKRLQKIFTYVLDMPIRLKPGHRPKYRMIHACNHEAGCYLMAENMQKRKDELFFIIQQSRRATLFDFVDTIGFSIENNLVTSNSIEKLLFQFVNRLNKEIGLKKFFAEFFNKYGLICSFKMLTDALKKFECQDKITITRIPGRTSTGKESVFWTENSKQKILIRKNK